MSWSLHLPPVTAAHITSWANWSITDSVPLLGDTSVASGVAVGKMFLSGDPSLVPWFLGMTLGDTYQTHGHSRWPLRCLLPRPLPRIRSPVHPPPGRLLSPGAHGSPPRKGVCGPKSCGLCPGALSPVAPQKPGGVWSWKRQPVGTYRRQS